MRNNFKKTYFSAQAGLTPHMFFFHVTEAANWVLEFLNNETKTCSVLQKYFFYFSLEFLLLYSRWRDTKFVS